MIEERCRKKMVGMPFWGCREMVNWLKVKKWPLMVIRHVVLVGECCGISRRCRHVSKCWCSMTLKDVIYDVL
jgi:hypothetical protein